MSRIYFHSPTATAELRGSERAWLNHVSAGSAAAAWDLDGGSGFERACEIIAMVPEVPDGQFGANYLHTYMREAQAQEAHNKEIYRAWRPGQALPHGTDHEPQRKLVTALDTRLRGGGVHLDVAGHRLHSADVNLNTALVAGSDPVRLAAKLHGWCESHTWVDGPDRAWLASIIEQGLAAGMFRRGLWYADHPDGPRDKWSDQGWGDVVDLLRSRDDEPVVTSYSVCDQFPNPEIAGAGTDRDRWYALPCDAQWEQAMAGLRRERPWARLASDTLDEVTFGPPVTVYDLLAPDRAERVRAACAKAVTVGDPSYRTVKGILVAGAETDPPPPSAGDGGAAAHLHGPSQLFANVIPLPTTNGASELDTASTSAHPGGPSHDEQPGAAVLA